MNLSKNSINLILSHPDILFWPFVILYQTAPLFIQCFSSLFSAVCVSLCFDFESNKKQKPAKKKSDSDPV